MRGLAAILVLATYSIFAADVAFEAQTVDEKIQIGYGLAIGDVDGDKKPDILLADKNEIVWYRNPDWTRYVMCANVSKLDNVCIAARDIDGDGKVEVAIGATWNPADTVDSGSVHYLVRPTNPDHEWEVVTLHREPTVHRMHWVRCGDGKFRLIVKPLHGKGNKGGEGPGGRVLAYEPPGFPLTAETAKKEWKTELVFDGMNITHNFDPYQLEPGKADSAEGFIIGGKQGLRRLTRDATAWKAEVISDHAASPQPLKGVGEVRQQPGAGNGLIATVEPFHGNQLCVYRNADGKWERQVVDETFKEAHALAFASLNGETNQIVTGWRTPNAGGKIGIAIFYPENKEGTKWRREVLDDNTMACEDLKVADLNGDGKPDVIAAGRATKNLKVYWNKGAK